MTDDLLPNPEQHPTRPTRRRRQGGTWAVRSNFSRMEQTFGTGALVTATLTRPDDPSAPRTPVSDVKPLVESDVLGKVGQLALMATVAGAVSFVFPVSLGLALVFVVIAFGLGLWAIFAPRRARVLAPVYAVTEGFALGVISRLYNAQTHGIVPMAIILTVALFVGVLVAYRTGLVRVSNRFVSMTIVAGFGLLAVMLASLLGLGVPGLGHSAGTFLIFGVIYVVVAIMDLFVDFELVRRAARAGVPADAEWYAAFSIFLAVVMLYLGLLRMVAGARR